MTKQKQPTPKSEVAELKLLLKHKNQELEIESALEKVRSRSMAMQQSNELTEVIAIVFQQLKNLHFDVHATALVLIDEDGAQVTWLSGFSKEILPKSYRIPPNDHPYFTHFMEMWKSGVAYDHFMFEGELKKSYDSYIFEESEFKHAPKEVQQAMRTDTEMILSSAYMKYGWIEIDTYDPISEEKSRILQRFAKVFEQTYTRFLDLQKAEAQAREAQIEAALERVRAASMAMHKSEELTEVSKVLNKELQLLGLTQSATCGFVIVDENERIQHYYGSPAGKNFLEYFQFPLAGDQILRNRYEAWNRKDLVFKQSVSGKKLQKHLAVVLPDSEITEAEKNAKLGMPDPTYFYLGNFAHGYLQIIASDTLSEDQIFLLPRFAKVFEQTYIRFLDLKKAEEQARDAQIEAALERIRNRSLVMKDSDELNEVVAVFFQEFQQLNLLSPEARTYFCDINTKTHTAEVWMTYTNGEVMTNSHQTPLTKSTSMRKYYEAWKRKDPVSVREYKGKNLNTYLSFVSTLAHVKKDKDYKKLFKNPPKRIFMTDANFLQGNIGIMSFEPLSHEALDILIRFAKVFEFTYTRFLDLKKAEAQTREAQIEAALERVRAASMAMHKSNELLTVISSLFEQLVLLGFDSSAASIILYNEDSSAQHWMAGFSNEIYPQSYRIPFIDLPYYTDILQAWKNGIPYKVFVYKGKQKKVFDDYLFTKTDFKNFPARAKKKLRGMPKAVLSDAFMKYGIIETIGLQSLQDEQASILSRFAKVFEQTYTRFLDLQKAEAQAREAQVEASLERVRAKSMAMHKSEDLSATVTTVFTELEELGFKTIRCGIGIFNDNSKKVNVWTASDGGNNKTAQLSGDEILEGHPLLDGIYDAYNDQKDYSYVLQGEDLISYYNVTADSNLPVSGPKANFNQLTQYYHCVMFPAGGIFAFKDTAFTDEAKQLMKRFADVFHLTFIRHLDLMQAEAQARETQIELALERVRAKTMAMHNSHDVGETVSIMFDELVKLGIEKSIRCGVGIFSKTKFMEVWTASSNPDGEVVLNIGKLDMTLHPMLAAVKAAWENKEQSFSYELVGDDLKTYYDAINHAADYSFQIDIKSLPEKVIHNDFHFSEGIIYSFSSDPFNEETSKIFKRFASVFGQTYRRYLDLKRAEAQAREAQIEAALERIRAKALAMQSSADLHDVSIVLREQMGLLGQQDLESSIVHLYNNSETLESWYTFRSTETTSTKVVTDVAFIPVDSCDYIKETLEKYNSKETEYTIISKGKKLHDWYKVMVDVAPDTIEYDDKGNMLVPDILYYHHSKFLGGALLMISNQPPSEESKELQRRAAKGFNFAYQRFLDLKKAEAQAREAQIEASLERIRAQAMAMQHSNDLIKSTTILFEELEKLKLSVERSGIGIFDEETRDCQLWTTVVTNSGDTELATGITSLTIHPMLIQTFGAWKSQESLLYVLQGKELEDYYKLVSNSEFHLPDEVIENSAALPKEYYLYTPFGAGGIYVFSDTEPTSEEQQILRRFAEVFHLTYTRYEDLQKAEERAFEAIKQASLDRVRAEIASMRTTEDLNRITPLVWKELTALGVPFIRCGVLIMDEKRRVIQSYLSAPDGHSLGVFDLPFESKGIATGALDHWKKGTIYKDHWNKDQFIKFSKNLVKLGQVQDITTYQGADSPPESLDLHFVPFKQGMLYVGNTLPLSEEEIKLVQALAEAFSIAYARYEDFTQLEEAKNQIEIALGELKSTQTQLIHAEKMASLGELTAGIAHEIQNPLNFVNNFSEVSVDLIEELKEERLKLKAERDENLEEEILDDVIENLGKINHHGERASSIVKGMLEHSRTGKQEKELTDLNVLADEYLRLSYHGLRAKDKSFNADFNADLDDKLPKVKVISQDIGRVLLNLINNAFYAVSKKSKDDNNGYVPEVFITTKRNDKTVEIIVGDNGEGIPKDALDKIFQPFFTTKPTGQGTGLGLSLSYDIITKGHDGHLEVETEEGVGTRFIIILPA